MQAMRACMYVCTLPSASFPSYHLSISACIRDREVSQVSAGQGMAWMRVGTYI